MTAARLEELAAKVEMALAPETPDISSVLELQDISDLARCARAWAKVERSMMAAPGFVELFGYPRREHHWSWYPTNQRPCKPFAGPTALEAVEAAEVKP